jgi:hypothetical protein
MERNGATPRRRQVRRMPMNSSGRFVVSRYLIINQFLVLLRVLLLSDQIVLKRS